MGNLQDRYIAHSDSAECLKKSKATAVQEAARKSLAQWLKPISAFVLDCGLSASEVNSIFRMAAVSCAAERQLEDSNRVNISGISAVTGIPRGEVSRILKFSGSTTVGRIKHRNVASRILSAWHRDPRFLTADHHPRDLKLFGSGLTFESLVRTYGQGIPVRALLDELRRVGAVHILPASRKILPKMPLAIHPCITQKKIRNYEAVAKAIFFGLLNPNEAAFADRVSVSKVWSGPSPLIRGRAGPNATRLLREFHDKLAQRQAKQRRGDTRKLAHLSVTIVYVEPRHRLAKRSLKGRRNLRRVY